MMCTRYVVLLLSRSPILLAAAAAVASKIATCACPCQRFDSFLCYTVCAQAAGPIENALVLQTDVPPPDPTSQFLPGKACIRLTARFQVVHCSQDEK
mgnify:CR=1 FL=1